MCLTCKCELIIKGTYPVSGCALIFLTLAQLVIKVTLLPVKNMVVIILICETVILYFLTKDSRILEVDDWGLGRSPISEPDAF